MWSYASRLTNKGRPVLQPILGQEFSILTFHASELAPAAAGCPSQKLTRPAARPAGSRRNGGKVSTRALSENLDCGGKRSATPLLRTPPLALIRPAFVPFSSFPHRPFG